MDQRNRKRSSFTSSKKQKKPNVPLSTEKKGLAIVLSEGTYDKAMAALMLATTARGTGKEAHIFFTFWGLSVLKKKASPKLSGMMKPFTWMMERKMRKLGIPTFPELMEMAQELGVRLYGCSTTMKLMGIDKEDLVPETEVVGAASFLRMAEESDTVLFI